MRRIPAVVVAIASLAGCGGGDDGSGGGDRDAGRNRDAAPGSDGAAGDGAAADAGPAPDLVVLGDAITASIDFGDQTFTAGSCSIAEACVGGIGTRRLLRFDTAIVNEGDAPFVLGVPDSAPPWVYAECHAHYHIEDFLVYELVDSGGVTVASTGNDTFCVSDFQPYASGAGAATYDCELQGISVGWGDVREDGLPCQWIDITGIAAGDYQLRVSVNGAQVRPESDYTNNVVEVPVTVPPP